MSIEEKEKPEVVGYRYAFGDDLLLDHRRPHGKCDELMTVAQHERIVAALHCELATFKQVNLDMGSELREHRQRAQPARQVGDEQSSAGDAWLWHALRSQYGDESQAEEGFYAGWIVRDALAPATAVMPTHKPTESGFDGQRTFSLGYNSALDEVARLNRRAIPEELLERICLPRNESTGWAASADAINELRALLGKEGV